MHSITGYLKVMSVPVFDTSLDSLYPFLRTFNTYPNFQTTFTKPPALVAKSKSAQNSIKSNKVFRLFTQPVKITARQSVHYTLHQDMKKHTDEGM